jgi:lipopolysaccharide transport system permease protein
VSAVVTVNDANLRSPLLRWRELRAYHDFLGVLVWREIHLRYRHTLIGIGWSFLNPLMTMAIFGLIVPNLMSRQTLASHTHGVPYPLYVMCGLVPWNCFVHALTRANTCLLDQSALLKNMYFPRLMLPLSKIVAACVELVIALAALLALMGLFRRAPSPYLIFFPLFLAPLLSAALGGGLFLSVLQLRYRDILFLLQFVVQLGLLVTPVWFPLEALPKPIQWAIACNPMTAVIQGFRWAAFHAPPPSLTVLASSSITSLALLAAGVCFFRSRQETIADYV